MALRQDRPWYEEPLAIELSLEDVLADLDEGVALEDPVGASA